MAAGYNLGTARGSVEIDTSGVGAASRDLRHAELTISQTGRSLWSFGKQALGAFAYVINIGAQFEKEMDFVQAATRATDKEIVQLKETAIALGKYGPYGPVELSESFRELAKAGIEVNEIVEGVGKAVVDLAGAADISAA